MKRIFKRFNDFFILNRHFYVFKNRNRRVMANIW